MTTLARTDGTVALRQHPARVTRSADRREGKHDRRTVRVALLGCGTVGNAVAARLMAEDDHAAASPSLRLVRVLVRDVERARSAPAHLLTNRPDDVLDTRPDIIIEALGGEQPAHDLILRAIDHGTHIVTANKTVVAHHGDAITARAKKRDVSFRSSAAVGAATPFQSIVREARELGIQSIVGILNGTSNAVLSEMTAGKSLDCAVKEAQRRGYAEPDPSRDLSGRDAAEKLAILAREVGLGRLGPQAIQTCSLSVIDHDVILFAHRHGFSIKPLAILRGGDDLDGISAAATPALVPHSGALARVSSARNALSIRTRYAGDVFIEGEGAGPGATAAAIISDCRAIMTGHCDTSSRDASAQRTTCHLESLSASGWLVHMITRDRAVSPESVLQHLRAKEITLRHIETRRSELWIMTGAASAAQLHACLDETFPPGATRTIIPVWSTSDGRS